VKTSGKRVETSENEWKVLIVQVFLSKK